jgi:hypothetical protein
MQVIAGPQDQQFYESSNGDVRYLGSDSLSGARVVIQRPNSKSGGKVSSIDVHKFLLESPTGSQHQALRILIGAG